MKRSTSFIAVALTAMAVAAPAQAQIIVPDWNEDGKFTYYPEDLVCEGGVAFDEDLGAFVFDGTPGKIMINIPEGAIMDWSEVARIEVFGSLADADGEDHELTYYAWNSWDPLGSFTVRDRDILNPDGENIVNTWMGSRYKIDYSAKGDKEYHEGRTYAAMSAHVVEVCWGTREIPVDEEGNPMEIGNELYIDEIVLTKSVEVDPNAITADMWFEWDGVDGEANIVGPVAGIGIQLNTSLGGGSVFAGPLAGVVPGNLYADLTPYKGIYVKGTPGTPWRGLFNRQEMGDSGAYVNIVREIPETGELFLMFDDEFKAAFEDAGISHSYIHLNSSKINWGAPEGAKISKFNYLGEDGIQDIIVDAANDGVIYNVYGQRVNENYKGIIIKNGKKYYNK